MALNETEKQWYINHINRLDPQNQIVKVDLENSKIIYSQDIMSDESLTREATPEELVRALALCMLCSNEYRYECKYFYIEKYYSIGRPSQSRAEIDLIIYDHDELAFSVWEFKSAEDYEVRPEYYIEHQLYDPAPLIGAPKYLVYATILPQGDKPTFKLINIDYQKYPTFEKWVSEGQERYDKFPSDYEDQNIVPLIKGSEKDLDINTTHKEFKSLAKAFHQEFWAENQDTDLFKSLVQLFLAKIYDERNTKPGEKYQFQIFHSGRKEESSLETFNRIQERYKDAYQKYIEPDIKREDIPEISIREFSPDKVKFVVRKIQNLSFTMNTANQGDIVGGFFEEILRDGFKQDKGMYFTHSNLAKFMIEAIDLKGLAIKTFMNANHHNNRLPYVIDPSCGSGTFLVAAMNTITKAILEIDQSKLDEDSREFIYHHLSELRPNHWAKDFIYGFDPKFIMALTAKVNMVLHGDGSAHIYKLDGLAPLSSYPVSILNEHPVETSSVSSISYNKPVCERFDVVLTNPPFGVTIEDKIKRSIPYNFTLSATTASESLFFERWFQLLKPKGRLAAVLPESFFSTSENINARLILYRFFNIKAIVSLPQNMFVDTPTLTSLLFAQKKTKEEIEAWDSKWNYYEKKADEVIYKITEMLKVKNCDNILELKEKILSELSKILDVNGYIVKKGKSPIPIIPQKEFENLSELKEYYRGIMKLAGFKQYLTGYIFKNVAKDLNYTFKTYCVDEVGYKLSKRNEKTRPNQLCTFVDEDGNIINNLHATDKVVEVKIDTVNPKTVLDFIRRDVKWD